MAAATRELDRLRAEVADLQTSRRRLAMADDGERREIERELHGGVQQHLAALSAYLQLAGSLIGVDPPAAETALEEAARVAGLAVNEAQDLARRIYPPLHGSGGLAAAIRSAAASANVPTRLDVGAHTAWPPAIARAVYLCCLEMVEHAAAGTEAVVTVRDGQAAVVFEIVVAPGSSEIDHAALRDRIEALDGTLHVESRDGVTTRMAGSIPLSR